MEKKLLDIQDLANALNVSLSKIYKDVNNGLPHFKVGSKLRFYLDEVLEFYRKNKKES